MGAKLDYAHLRVLGLELIKTFIAANAEKAKAKAQRAMGHKVILLNIRDLPSGDVEVTAGNEEGAKQYRLNNPNPVTPIVENASSHETANTNLNNLSDPNNESPKRQKSGPFGFFSRKSDKQDQHFIPGQGNPSDNAREEGALPLNNNHSGEEGLEPSSTSDPYDGTSAENLDYQSADVPQREPQNPATVSSGHSDQYKPLDAGPNTNSLAGQQLNPEANSGSRLHETLEQRSTENNLNQLRERLTGQQQPDTHFDDPAFTSLIGMLRAHGVSNRLMTMILNGARKATVDDDLYQLGMGLKESFNFSPLRSTASVPIMLVGPTGAGKTSCAAKLSALALNENEPATMITTDVGRAGALEQFATYSEKLNIECYAAQTPEEIVTIMKEAQPKGAVILDTPGISPYDAGDLAALKSYQTAIGAEPVLVLPASGDVGEYTDWAHAFRAFGVRSCIITKFDATRRVGAGISAAFEGNMTLTYFSETPFISEGLLPASPEFLAYRLTANYPGRLVQS